MTIGVCVPVGPKAHHQDYLVECLRSVIAQTRRPDHIQMICDKCYLQQSVLDVLETSGILWDQYFAPWYLGVAHAFNFGVALSPCDFVFMLGADDTLEPDCLLLAEREVGLRRGNPYGYYFVGVTYTDTGEEQYEPCNAALVGKAMWHLSGGFPIESSTGSPDCALLSILLQHGIAAGYIYPVAKGKPLYNYRRHGLSHSAGTLPWQGVILKTRELVTDLWQPRLA